MTFMHLSCWSAHRLHMYINLDAPYLETYLEYLENYYYKFCIRKQTRLNSIMRILGLLEVDFQKLC